MKKAIIAGAILLVLALDWAALHDIVKGNEPNLWAEWTMVLGSIVLIPALLLLGRGKTSAAH